MADLKISQLSSVTTPLAGTETLPVVQSGSTKKVTVSDLTAGRDVNAKSLAVSDFLSVTKTTAPYARIRSSDATASNATLYLEIANNFSGLSQTFIQGIGPGISGVSQLAFGVSTSSGSNTATEVARFDTGGNFRPSADNVYSCGTGALRWSVIYSATALINTSDGRTKQQVRNLSEAERAVAKRLKSLIKAFKFNDAVVEKGDDARIHFGVIAQDVKAAFEAEGLIAENYGLLCHDSWEDEFEDVFEEQDVVDENNQPVVDENNQPVKISVKTGTKKIIESGDRYGVRYEELFAFVIYAL